MSITEDFTVYLADFGQAATLDGAAVTVILDNGYSRAAVGPFGMASAQPQVGLPTASVPASPVGKSLVVGGVSYTVAEHQPDGTGMSTLLLEAA